MERRAIGIIVVLLATAVAGFAEDRVALAVGINNYAKVGRLEKAATDTRAVGDTLRRLGFKVDLALDVDRRGFNRAISDFLNKIKPGAIAYFHYSSHGVSIDNDTYLIILDMELPTSDDREFVKRGSIRLSELIDSLKDTKASARGIGGGGGISLMCRAKYHHNEDRLLPPHAGDVNGNRRLRGACGIGRLRGGRLQRFESSLLLGEFSM